MSTENLKIVEIVASGIRDILENTVFAGGSVMELYIDNPKLSIPRVTDDVDIVVEILTRAKYDEFEEILRKKGFKNDIDGPACRMIYKDILTDIISTGHSAAGFTNKWYEDGFEKRISAKVNNTEIKIFPVEYFVASKFEAYKGRGMGSVINSHDIEDIIYVFDGRDSIADDIKISDDNVKEFIKTEIKNIIENPSVKEIISGHLGYGATIPVRRDRIIKIFDEILK